MNWFKRAGLGDGQAWVMPSSFIPPTRRGNIISGLERVIQQNSTYLAQLGMLDYEQKGKNINVWFAKVIEGLMTQDGVKGQRLS